MNGEIVKFIERTCTEVSDTAGDTGRTESRPLSDFRDCGVYVLLGAPGAGKTEAFKHEAGGQGFCDARDFVTYSPEPCSPVTPLFIDALDEMRAGSTDERTPLDTIRRKLEQLGRPRFRLSCREADWFGAPDRKRLESVSPDGVVRVLRLDPLNDDGIRTMLGNFPQVTDPDEFIVKARERGLDSVLANPKSLELLVQAVTAQGSGAWPDTRLETFDLACRSVVREHNDEHARARKNPLNVSDLLDKTGYVCAVQLLTGSAGYRLMGSQPVPKQYIGLDELADVDAGTLRLVLGSKLFRPSGGNCMVPVHRHLAEFLAGRCLAGLVDDSRPVQLRVGDHGAARAAHTGLVAHGLPVQRVLALMTGEDGRTVSALRGLAAWFAAHCTTGRKAIIERDPLGAVLYGDVRSFSVADKRFLLRCLEQDAERDPRAFEAMHDLDSRWEDLATTDMEDTFREILTHTQGSQGRQTVALAVLRSLERDAVIPGVAPILLDVVRDGGCGPAIRDAALEAYVRQSRDDDAAQGTLKALLADVYDGTVPDPRDELLGLLLQKLYPDLLPPVELGRYLREWKSAIFGRYAAFWSGGVVAQSTNSEQLAEVLDSLVENHEDAGKTTDIPISRWLRTVPARLLAAHLKRSPTVDPERLFAWLGLAAQEAGRDAQVSISAWLSKHPAAYKAVVRLAANRYAGASQLRDEVFRRLFSADEPKDFGAWCLNQVVETERNTEAATEFFLEVIASQGDERTSSEVEERLAHDPDLTARYKALRESQQRSIASFKGEQGKSEQWREADARQRRQEWRDLVKEHEPALLENRAAPALLDRLASAWLGWIVGVEGKDGRARLQDLLGSDDLVDTAIEALRAAATRSDLPNMTEIFRLTDQGRRHLLMFPVLVGLGEHSSLHPGMAPLDEQGMRRALAFRFNAPDVWNREPEWYRAVLQSRPDLVADVLIRSVRASLRRGENSALGLHELGHDDDYRPVACRAVKPLLRSFPTRHKIDQLRVLNVLLHLAPRHIDDRDLMEIIEGKLALRSMDAAQRMYWICAGLLLRPRQFTDQLRSKLVGRGYERRVRHAAEFLYHCDALSLDALDVTALELLVESLGKSYRPVIWRASGSRTTQETPERPPHYTGLIVGSLINALSSKPSRDAAKALERLSADDMLRPWHRKLQDAANQQQEIRREAAFRHPAVKQVLAALAVIDVSKPDPYSDRMDRMLP